MSRPGVSISPMAFEDIAVLESWAIDEGWNPGCDDLRLAWETDRNAFIALRREGELVGGGSTISYGGRFGFMGLFILKSTVRRQGLGALLWRYRLERLQQRLQPGAPIGMDGVFQMVPFYKEGGFAVAYRDLRFQGVAKGTLDPSVRTLQPADFDAIDRVDRRHFPVARTEFLQRWIFRPRAHVLGIIENDGLVGYGVARQAPRGYKIGPLFADRPDIAERLLTSLMSHFVGQQVQIDVP